MARVSGMGIEVAAANDGQRLTKPLAIIRALLLVLAVLSGLFTMHVIGQPLVPVESSNAAESFVAHPGAQHHLPAAETGQHSNHGCAGCPTGHDMSATSCLLALFAMLLLLSPPRSLHVAAPKDRLIRRVLLPVRAVRSIRPDLTALGICRT